MHVCFTCFHIFCCMWFFFSLMLMLLLLTKKCLCYIHAHEALFFSLRLPQFSIWKSLSRCDRLVQTRMHAINSITLFILNVVSHKHYKIGGNSFMKFTWREIFIWKRRRRKKIIIIIMKKKARNIMCIVRSEQSWKSIFVAYWATQNVWSMKYVQ